jgi:hypothetical protein
MAEPAAERRRRRRRWPLYLLLAVLLTLVGVVAARERIAAWAATEALRIRYGLPSSLAIDHIDQDSARIAAVSLGGDGQIKASDISLQFDAAGMQVNRIEIGQVELHARYDGHALTLDEVDPLLRELTAPADDAEAKTESKPLPSIILHKIAVTVETPLGTLSGDGMATIDKGVVYSQFTLTEPEQRSTVHLDLNAVLSNQTPQPQGNVKAELTASSVLWPILGLPQPQSGTVQIGAQLKVPTADTASGIRLVSGAVMLTADWTAKADGLAWPGQPAPADLDANGRAVLAERRLELPKFELRGTGGWSPDLALHVQGSALASLSGAQSSAQASLDLNAQGKSAAFGSAQLQAPVVDLGLQLQYGGDTLQIHPSRDGTIKFAQASFPGLKIQKPTTLTIRKADQSSVTLPIPPLGGAPISASVAIATSPTELTVPGMPTPLQVTLPNATLTTAFSADAPLRYTVDARNATLALANPAASAKNVTLALKSDGGKLDLSVNTPALAGPSGFGPGTLDAKATLDGNKLAANAKVMLPASKTTLTAKGGYDLGSGKGRFDIDLPAISFVPGGLQPHDLLPSLKGSTEDVSGTVAAKGPVLIDKTGVTSQIALNLQGMSGKFGPITLRNLNSVIEVDRPWPLTTAADQVLSVELADVGLPLTNGLVRFKVDDGNTLSIAESHLEMMSGQVILDPAVLKLGAPAQQIHLNVQKIAVEKLFQLFAIAGLTGDGLLSGEIPVTLFPAGLAIDHAKLAAEAPGHLRYDKTLGPAALASAGDSMKMALDALSDFHYDRLEIDLDRAATGDTQLDLHIAGKNPSFYNGYPVEFNLSVTGRLDEALRKGLAGYQVPDMIRDRLKSFNQ